MGHSKKDKRNRKGSTFRYLSLMLPYTNPKENAEARATCKSRRTHITNQIINQQIRPKFEPSSFFQILKNIYTQLDPEREKKNKNSRELPRRGCWFQNRVLEAAPFLFRRLVDDKQQTKRTRRKSVKPPKSQSPSPTPAFAKPLYIYLSGNAITIVRPPAPSGWTHPLWSQPIKYQHVALFFLQRKS